ncbi:mdtC domain protein [Acanthopleuribacter pedis]|uniref:MdtC domain protein n=1 Tax=Acanthopleuribacter pedis TaxID=442870 RepID=A0A8J7QE03_9BACT|nr:mdtC domain protein [Acanthopleuribacter pedis]MBO1318670.1 mdtC domain protein [Acanthopleuribacter pedis]
MIKLPVIKLYKWLSKLRNPQKHDAGEKELGSILDLYERNYIRLD